METNIPLGTGPRLVPEMLIDDVGQETAPPIYLPTFVATTSLPIYSVPTQFAGRGSFLFRYQQ